MNRLVRPRRAGTRTRLAFGLGVVLLLSVLAAPFAVARPAVAQDDEQPAPSASVAPDESAPPGSEEVESEVAEALPPADLPTGNLLGLEFDLEASLEADLDAAPAEATVYRLELPETSAEETAALAERLGIEGEVEDRGGGTFAVSGEGQLFVTPTLTQYLSPETPTLAELPSDEDAIDLARDWLRENELAPADLGEGDVSNRAEEVGRVAVTFEPVEPEPILAAYPSITVTLGPDGVVLEASIRWATITVAELYLLRPAEEAWRQVESGQAYLEADFRNPDLEAGTIVEGSVRYDDISIAYTTAGPPGGDQYLAPVYVFSGRVTTSGEITGSYEISAYVPAIASSETPVG